MVRQAPVPGDQCGARGAPAVQCSQRVRAAAQPTCTRVGCEMRQRRRVGRRRSRCGARSQRAAAAPGSVPPAGSSRAQTWEGSVCCAARRGEGAHPQATSVRDASSTGSVQPAGDTRKRTGARVRTRFPSASRESAARAASRFSVGRRAPCGLGGLGIRQGYGARGGASAGGVAGRASVGAGRWVVACRGSELCFATAHLAAVAARAAQHDQQLQRVGAGHLGTSYAR